MADDQLRHDLLMKLNLMGKVSDDTMLGERGLDAETEARKIKQELRRSFPVRLMQSRLEARVQGEAQLEMASLNQRISEQLATVDPGMDGGMGVVEGGPGTSPRAGDPPMVDLPTMAWAQASELEQMAPQERQALLSHIQQETPQYHAMLMSLLTDQEDPLPSQHPPRRRSSMI